MPTWLILIAFLSFTIALFVVSYFTSKKAKTDTFFVGERKMPWPLVAYGMIGASLSGVTFISIPGDVYNSHMSYLMVVFGNMIGYLVIAYVLLPIYYKMHVTTIYTYLQQRYGNISYRTGSTFFIISKLLGAGGRLYLVAFVLHTFIFKEWNMPFVLTAVIFIGLIMFYTYRGGIKTVIWTDTLQTTFMILSLVLCFVFIAKLLNISFGGLLRQVFDHPYSELIITDVGSRYYFMKQFFSGIFITIAMNGLDQDMMQKNLSCRNLKSAQKNIISMSLTMIPVVALFLILGVALYIMAESQGIPIPASTDQLFPEIMLHHLGPVAGIVFLIGLISAAYSSGDGALTALTTSFCVDFLGFEGERANLPESAKKKLRTKVHFSFAFIMILLMLAFKALNNQSIITTIFDIAGYTYGPLLGLFAFGLCSRSKLRDKYVPIVAILAPVITYIVCYISPRYWNYSFGFEKILLNGAMTVIGLICIIDRSSTQSSSKSPDSL